MDFEGSGLGLGFKAHGLERFQRFCGLKAGVCGLLCGFSDRVPVPLRLRI